ncbi:MAG: phosphate signaling complex protein PhoU [candidate division WOR-3 bacterium]
MIEEKINELKKTLITYAELIQRMVETSTKGLSDKDESLLKQIIEKNEQRANEYEIEIDEMCTTLIVTLQPKAIDLRTILMIQKINNDLERIGDHAVNISQSALVLIDQPLVKPLIDIPRMAEEAKQMINDAISAFINKDPLLAKEVCERDSVVDSLRDQIIRELITYMVADASTIPRALHLLNISKNLERIADLSTNICEDVIFLVEARVIKHHHQE